MKKVLQFLALAMLFAMTGTNFVLQAKLPKKSCTGQAKFNCTGSCEWRHNACRQKVKKQSNQNLQPLATGIDASQAPAGAAIVINNSNTPPNTASFTFYDANRAALNAPTTIWFNGQFVIIPTNAAFVSVEYMASNANHDIIQVMDMQPITPSTSYSLTNPNSSAQPDDSPASWVLTQNSSSSSVAPANNIQAPISYQSFNPATQFAGQGLVGQAMSDGTATIFDPSGNNPISYSFTNIQSGGVTAPAGLMLIGKITSRPQCSGTICSNAVRVTNLYGTLQQ